MEIKVENWNGYDIRFININGEWWAILKDICDALNLRTAKIAERLNPDMLERVRIDVPSKDLKSDDGSSDLGYLHESIRKIDKSVIGKDIGAKRGAGSFWMLAVNEIGIYEALFASRKLEARKFRQWTAGVLGKLRKTVGLEGYEVLRMTDPDVQSQIDYILDSLYYDEETGKVMRSVTVAGGDVEQEVFE